MNRLLLLSLLCVSTVNVLLAKPLSYIKEKDGVTVFTDPLITGKSNTVKLEVVADNIIRVIAAPGKEIPVKKSLVTVYTQKTDLVWDVTSSTESLTLKTRKLIATVNLKTGVVDFRDIQGRKILGEKQVGGRSFQPVVFDGKRQYNIVQTFQSTSDDAWYGLGQHQDGVFNYKGQQVNFFQNNTEVAVPFLISNKNYGILWDNYSLTTAGDIRPFHQLSSLKLFSKKGEPGWLNASYANDKNKPGQVICERAESSISMEFLGESKIQLPKEFIPGTGIVTWEGSLASHLSGLHQFKFIFGGTIKVWANGKLVLDRWRKAWNPAPALLPLHLKSGEKIPVRIEWTPEGDSYLSLKWQEPLSGEQSLESRSGTASSTPEKWRESSRPH